VAWQIVGHGKSVADISQIEVMDKWPNHISSRVPSECAYSGEDFQWGFDIGEDSERMIWTKLYLDKQTCQQELKWILYALDGMKDLRVGENAKYPKNKPQDIVTDYLAQIRKQVVEKLNEARANIFKTLPTELVVTIPAVSFAFQRSHRLDILIAKYAELVSGSAERNIQGSHKCWIHDREF